MRIAIRVAGIWDEWRRYENSMAFCAIITAMANDKPGSVNPESISYYVM